MGKFNQKRETANEQTKTVNLAGGEAFTQSPETEFASMLLTSFVDDKFYRAADEGLKRASDLIGQLDTEFVAKAAVYARRVMGMRAITHFVAAQLVPRLKGKPFGKDFFAAVVERPDDMTEIVGALQGASQSEKIRGAACSHALRKGFVRAFQKFDAYQLGKYRGEGKAVKLVDLVNIFHPKSKATANVNRLDLIRVLDGAFQAVSDKANKAVGKTQTDLIARASAMNNRLLELRGNEAETVSMNALEALTYGLLKSETYQTELVKSGQAAAAVLAETGDAEKAAETQTKMNAAAWREFLESEKTPHFALLRNLRNILTQAPELVSLACEKVSDAKAIRRSLVMPFRYLTALTEIEKLSSDSNTRKIVKALSDGLEITFENIPQFWGETLVVLDESGSMSGRPSEIGGLFAAAIAKKNNCDLLTFATQARYQKFNPNDSISTIKSRLEFNGGGTDFHTIFKAANKKYDRIIILSDMQGWVGHYAPTAEFKAYCQKYGANPFVYSWDLQGYGTTQFPENKIVLLAGFQSDIIELIEKGETNPKALVDEINALDLKAYLGKRPRKEKAKSA